MENLPERNHGIEALREHQWSSETSEHLRGVIKRAILDIFAKEVQIIGMKNLEKLPKNKTPVIVSNHSSNLDMPLIAYALGNVMNIQFAAMSPLFKSLGHRLLMEFLGADAFSPIHYAQFPKKVKEQRLLHHQDFEDIKNISAEGNKVPWIALHSVSLDQKMKQAGMGVAYLSQIVDRIIVPIAIEVEGKGADMDGPVSLLQAFTDKLRIKITIGEPVEFPKVDLAALTTLSENREALRNNDGRAKLKKARTELRTQADAIAKNIAKLLPEEKRGFYRE